MTKLRIKNNLGGSTPPRFLFWVSNSEQAPVNGGELRNINEYNYEDEYRFCINCNRVVNNAISWAYYNFTHCVEIIDTDLEPIVRLSPIPIFTDKTLDYIIKADRKFTPTIISREGRLFPTHVEYNFDSNTNCCLEVKLNSMPNTYNPSDASNGIITENLGENGIIEFQISGESQFNSTEYRIMFSDFPIRIRVTNKGDYNDVEISKYVPLRTSPESVNITIEPD